MKNDHSRYQILIYTTTVLDPVMFDPFADLPPPKSVADKKPAPAPAPSAAKQADALPVVFLDVSIGGADVGRIEILLRKDVVPRYGGAESTR